MENVTCVKAKLIRTSCTFIEKSMEPLELIYTDVCDFKLIQTRGDKKTITFINDCIKFCYLYLIRGKYEAIENFKILESEVKNQLNKNIKVLRNDRVGEYE